MDVKLELYSAKQIDAFNHCKSRINILEGSVRSGKSHIALKVFINELMYGPPGKYLIAGKSERTVLRNVIEPLNEMVYGIIRYNRGLGEFTLYDRKIYVVGASDERAESKIRGQTLAGALVDEASIIPASFWRMLLSRLSVEGAKLFATTNPDSPFHWLKTEYIDNESITNKSVHSFRLEDNPVLKKSYIDDLKREYSGLWYKRFIDGLWVLAEGAIYDFFDESLHVCEAPPTYGKYYVLGIDYGTANAFAATLVGFNDDCHPALWVEKEFYWDSKKMGYQRTDLEYAMDIKREFGGYPLRVIYLDPSAASFQTELRRQRLPVTPANNDVLDGIRYVSDRFIGGDLVIGRQCHNLIQEIQGYVWDDKAAKNGEDKPLKQRDHACDAMRYAIFSHWGKKKTLKEPTAEQHYQSNQQNLYGENPMGYDGYTSSYGWQRI